MNPMHYQQYLKARGQYPSLQKAVDAWRSVRYSLAQTTKRRLSLTYAEVEQAIAIDTGTRFYTIAGIALKLCIGDFHNDDAIEGFGKISSRSGYLEGHDRNDEYWVLDHYGNSTPVLIPEYTHANHYRDCCGMKYGKARANDVATEYRESDIKAAEEIYVHGEYSRRVALIIEGDDDGETEEWFQLYDLEQIYDWVASELDSYISQQRQAA